MVSNGTFQYIVERILNLHDKSIQNNVFSKAYIPDHINVLQKQTFQTLLKKMETVNSVVNKRIAKMQYFYETYHNFYFSKKYEERNEFLKYFGKVQRVYNGFEKLAFRYKWHKANLSVTTDLQLNEIENGQRNVMCIYHANAKYLFRFEDLLKIVYTSLTNTFMLFSEPLTIKNPYNNLPFGKSLLYYMHYFHVTFADIRYIPYDHVNVFTRFKQFHFDLSRFIDMNTSLLREYAIHNYISNSTKSQMQSDIIQFIKQYNIDKDYAEKILIDHEFPVDTLIAVMKPYLRLYIQSIYALTFPAQQNARKNMHAALQQFQKFNPCFGKRNIIFKYVFVDGVIKRVQSHIEFNCKHARFHYLDTKKFMTNHLIYTYSEENDAMEGDISNIYFADNDDDETDTENEDNI